MQNFTIRKGVGGGGRWVWQKGFGPLQVHEPRKFKPDHASNLLLKFWSVHGVYESASLFKRVV